MTSQQENKLILCGCGWLGGYLASHFRSQMTIYGTTRSEDKARALSQQGIQTIPYTLGDTPQDLLAEAPNSTFILNIPPGRRNTDLNQFTSAMQQLISALYNQAPPKQLMITYGSYIDNQSDIPNSAKLVAITDTAVAFTAGLMILPAIFSFNPNIDPNELSESSISMIFSFLPQIFLALQTSIGFIGASIVASIFFLLVFFAAITSLVSIFEVPVAALMDEKDYSRRKSLVVLGALLVIFAALCALSFGFVPALTSFTAYAGADKSFFDVVYDVFYDTILPLNGLLICIFVMYRWKRHNFNKALQVGAPNYKGSWVERYVDISVGTFIPLILAVIFVNTVALKYFGVSLFG